MDREPRGLLSDFFFVCYLFTNEQPVSEPLPNSSQGLPPTYQTATSGTHFGFRPSAYDKSCPSHNTSSVQNQSAPSSCAPGLAGSHGISLSCSDSVAHFCPSPSFEGSQLPKCFRCPVLCHELTLSTICKITCYARVSSPRTPSLLNISLGLRSATMAIKVTIFTIAVDFLKKIT